MVLGRVLLGEIICPVGGFPHVPVYIVYIGMNFVANLEPSHIHCFCLMVSLANPESVLLSVCMGVGGCGCFISSNAMHNGYASCPL